MLCRFSVFAFSEGVFPVKTCTQPPFFINVREAADLLGVSEKLVWRAVWRGDIPAKKLGRRTLIDRQQLVDSLEDAPCAKDWE